MWKKVLGFENEYEVSDAGEVRSIATSFKNSRPGRLLTPTKIKNGYLIVRLWKNSEPHSRYIHRLVAEAFFGAAPHGYDVNHKDGNRTNNQVENLEFVTRAENNLHAYRVLGRKAASKYGEEHPNSKLTSATVQQIRAEFETVKCYATLAKKYRVDWTTIKSIVLFKTWKGAGKYYATLT